MQYIDEFRDAASVQRLAEAIRRATTRPWTIMEVCGGQTHAIVRFGIDTLLPPELTLVHGPGCPVCVTPLAIIDQALVIAARPDVTFCTFGDMIRVPGTDRDLQAVKAAGGDVRIVYSPLDAVKLAAARPDREVVFFAVGFETTAPANAVAVLQAERLGLRNFTLLVSHVLVPPAIEAIMASGEARVQAFLAAGHVCTIMGLHEYEPIARRYGVPIVVTGFEPTDVLAGIHRCVLQLEARQARVENAYTRTVRTDGNAAAQEAIRKVFTIVDRGWRGIGEIPRSGLGFRAAYARFDAAARFDTSHIRTRESERCISGRILQGLCKPMDCPAFGKDCTPEHPLGATMVSSEGACAAYYHFRRHAPAPRTEAAAQP